MAAKRQTGRLMKAECMGCEMIVYLSRGAVVRHGMPSCACGERMYFSKLDVQLEALPGHAHEHPDFKAFSELEIRRAQRAARNSVLVPNRMRCGGCNAWISASNERHSCGFHNDVRGNRNHGRWVTGMSRAAAEMPF